MRSLLEMVNLKNKTITSEQLGRLQQSIVTAGTPEGMSFLKKCNISLNATHKNTPLLQCVMKFQMPAALRLGFVQGLLSKGANPNQRDTEGVTALMKAIQGNFFELETVNLLLEHGAKVNTLNAAKQSALYSVLLKNAGDHGRSLDDKIIPLLKSLIQAGANVDQTEPQHGPLLHKAIDVDSSGRILEILIQAKAKLEAVNNSKKTAVSYALYRGDFKCIKILIEHGAALPKDGPHEKNIFHQLVYGSRRNGTGAEELICFLLENPQTVALIDQLDGNGNTALHYAARHSIDLVRCLVEHGANVNALDLIGENALSDAILNHQEETVAYLISQNAAVNLVNQDGQSLLHRAVMVSDVNLNVIKMIVEHPEAPPLDLEDGEGHTAVSHTDAEEVKSYLTGVAVMQKEKQELEQVTRLTPQTLQTQRALQNQQEVSDAASIDSSLNTVSLSETESSGKMEIAVESKKRVRPKSL